MAAFLKTQSVTLVLTPILKRLEYSQNTSKTYLGKIDGSVIILCHKQGNVYLKIGFRLDKASGQKLDEYEYASYRQSRYTEDEPPWAEVAGLALQTCLESLKGDLATLLAEAARNKP